MAKKKTNKTEAVTNCDQLSKKNSLPVEVQNQHLDQVNIESLIIIVRGIPVLIDRDISMLYDVDTKALNQSAKRNSKRFPERFRFQLTQEEKTEVVTNCDRLKTLRFSTSLPYAYTEQGISMLSAVIHSDTAIDTSIRIMDAFVAMRHFLAGNAQIFQRMANIEYHQIVTDKRIDELFKRLDANVPATQGIFFDGQIFDAYQFVCDLVRTAKKTIVLIDNYVDETVLTLLDKRKKGVEATIYTQHISQQLQLDISKHNSQYAPIEVKQFNKAHDRFLLIDDAVYHIGASIKDLGKKWFAFTLMKDLTAGELIKKVE